jgi:predicted nuclease of predicted toxin-antitoxin system
LGIEAVAVRDRGLINAEDQAVFEYAYKNDYIVVTANIKDFEQIARAAEIHPGIIFICDGELIRAEQVEVVTLAAIAIPKRKIHTHSHTIAKNLRRYSTKVRQTYYTYGIFTD